MSTAEQFRCCHPVFAAPRSAPHRARGGASCREVFNGIWYSLVLPRCDASHYRASALITRFPASYGNFAVRRVIGLHQPSWGCGHQTGAEPPPARTSCASQLPLPLPSCALRPPQPAPLPSGGLRPRQLPPLPFCGPRPPQLPPLPSCGLRPRLASASAFLRASAAATSASAFLRASAAATSASAFAPCSTASEALGAGFEIGVLPVPISPNCRAANVAAQANTIAAPIVSAGERVLKPRLALRPEAAGAVLTDDRDGWEGESAPSKIGGLSSPSSGNCRFRAVSQSSSKTTLLASAAGPIGRPMRSADTVSWPTLLSALFATRRAIAIALSKALGGKLLRQVLDLQKYDRISG